MHANSMSKFHSIVAIVVFTFGFSIRAGAESSPQSCTGTQLPVTSANGTTTYQCVRTIDQEDCKEGLTKINDILGSRPKVNQNMVSKYEQCQYDQAFLGNENIDEDAEIDLDDETGTKAQFDAQCAEVGVIKSCAGFEENDPKDAFKEAQKDLQEAKKDLMETQQRIKKDTKSASRKLQSIEQKSKEDARAYESSIKDINQNLEDAEKKLNQEAKKALEEKRALITSKESQLTTFNDQLREMELKLAESQNAQIQACVSEARQKLEESKNEQKKEKAEAKQRGDKYNFQSTNLAGASNRKKAALQRQLQEAYVVTYKDCMGGTTVAGVAAATAIKNANGALEKSRLSIEEKKVNLAKEIKDIQQQVINDASAMAENRDSLRKRVALQLENAHKAYVTSLERASLERANTNEDLRDLQEFAMQSSQLASDAVAQAQGRLQTAELKKNCNPKVSTSSSAEKLTTNLDKYIEAESSKKLLCSQYATKSCSIKACEEAKPSTPARENSNGSSAVDRYVPRTK